MTARYPPADPAIAELLAEVLDQYDRRARLYRELGGSTRSGIWLRGEQTLYLPRRLLRRVKRALASKKR